MRRRAADHSAREKQERDYVKASEFAYIDDGELKPAKALILYPLFWLVITQNTIMMLKSTPQKAFLFGIFLFNKIY